jgi:hypothetical protein
MWKLYGKGRNDMGLLSQDVNSRIFHNGHQNISHNIMWGYLFATMGITKKVDPDKVQRVTTNVMWYQKDEKTQFNAQHNKKNIWSHAYKRWLGELTIKHLHLTSQITSSVFDANKKKT